MSDNPGAPMPQAPVRCESDDYTHTFYGILNRTGQFWTPLAFHDEKTAAAHLAKWDNSERRMADTHKIVPVRISLEARPDAPCGPMRDAREQGLKVEIVDGRLIVSIGVDALMTAVKGGPTWTNQEEEECGWKITSDDGFAADIAHELQDEEEDGTTLVHVMLDAAIERAIEQGSLNIDFAEDN